ncbi:MAG: YciK family oxidoreductase [bacterium]|nr:YciK family oxidoreductase [Gammaproteobacteria bacterium]HIL96073.1 YciK family oxidoreductase [Pseudomonadales bacterium]
MSYHPQPRFLDNKTILVTGAGDGIGKTAAIEYARFGATVVLLGRTVSKLEQVYDEIKALNLAEPGIAPMDLATASMDDMQELANVILDNYGKLDGLVHNAAILGDRVPFEHYDMNTWLRVMQINFNAACLLTRILLPAIQQAPEATVIFTSTGVGKIPRAYWGAYSVSKYALEGFAMLLADELENTSKISVNILNPGATRTDMRRAAYPNENPAELKSAEELMPLYLYLMSQDSQENGETFTMDWFRTGTSN